MLYVIVQGQGFMVVNQPESKGIAQGQGRFTSPYIFATRAITIIYPIRLVHGVAHTPSPPK